ncbi:LOW QUALITY PROTEIN: serine-rich adhesin for platelets-like [Stegodyphus dumicola]|uniref:LOW QUALITY PROTEIN: serine-rich adhesin for platelets-like n=1 Tax=Stegodyphus dumicola TaxID=202533 RepID=UPI0015B19082|nr:LOW QUALITY PROTEIN: serine-rich adhesin for platelets-like [Stegodyphus dumicola]
MSCYRVSVIFLFILWIKLTVSAPMQDALGRRAREKGCYYLSDHYDNGERIVTNEPCLNCTCLNSMLMCYLRICPFIKPVGEECIIERDEGDCCPKIWCPEVINEKKCDDPSHDEKHNQHPGCYLNDKYYPDGAQLPRDPKRPCEVCYCIRNSTACVMQECELKVEGCSPVYKEGQCCPCRYNCTYEESTTAPPGVTLQELAEGCNLPDGTFVEDGAAVNSTNPCEHCYCMRNEVVCAIQECQAPGDDCKPLPPKPDQCCPDRYECPVLQLPESSSIHPETFLSFTTVFASSADVSTELAPIKNSGIKGSSQKGIEAGKYSPASSVKGAPSKVSYDQEATTQLLTDDYAQTDKPSLEIVNSDKVVSKPQPEKKSGIKGGSKTVSSTRPPPHELAVLSESDDDSGDQFNDSEETSFTVEEIQIPSKTPIDDYSVEEIQITSKTPIDDHTVEEIQITSKSPIDDYSVKPSSGTAIKGFGVPSSSVKDAPSKVSYDQEATTQLLTDDYAQTDKSSLEIVNSDKVVSKPQPGEKSGIKGGSKTVSSTRPPPHELAVLSESDDDSGDQFNDSEETSFTVEEIQIPSKTPIDDFSVEEIQITSKTPIDDYTVEEIQITSKSPIDDYSVEEIQITSKTPIDDYSVKPLSGTAIKGFGVKGGVSEKNHSATSISEVSPDSSSSTTEFYVKESTTHVPLEEHIERNVTEISSEVTTQTLLESSILDGKVTSKNFSEEETSKPSLKPSGVKGVQNEAISDPESNFHLPSFKPMGVKEVPAKVDDTQKKPAINHVGVKGTPQEEHHFRGKGRQPIHADSLRRRPFLPIGAIPGEIRQSTVAPVTKDGVEKLPPILSVSGEGICKVGDIVYQNGQVMKPINVCKKDCRCIDSVILCSDVICNETETKNVSSCRIIQEADECCPRYECDNFGSTDNISLSVTTVNQTQDKEVIFDGLLFGNKTSPIDSDEEILERNLTTTSFWQSTLDLITSTIPDKLFGFTKVVTDQPQNVSETDILEFISPTTAHPQKSNQTVSETAITEIPNTSEEILATGDKTVLHINTEEAFETSSWSPESSTHALVEDETTLTDSPKESSENSSLISEESGDTSAGSTLSVNISVEEVTQPSTSFTEIQTETINGDFTQSISIDESSSVTELSKDILTEEKQKLTPNISIDEISQTTAHITEVPEKASTGIPPLNISIEESSQTTAHVAELPIETFTGILTLNMSNEEAAQTPPSTEVQRDKLFEETESTTYSLPHVSDDILVAGKINDTYENVSKTSDVSDAEETIHVTENNVSIPVSETNPSTVEYTYTTIKYSSDPTPVTFNLSTVIPFEETETKDASIISLKTSTLPTSLSESSQTDFEITSSVLEADKHSDAVDDKAYQTVTSVPAIEVTTLTEIPEVSDLEISTSSKHPEVNETFYTTLQENKSQPSIDNFPEILTSTKLSFEDIENISQEVSNDTKVYDVTSQTDSSKSENTTYKNETESIKKEAFSSPQTTTISTTAASEVVDTDKVEIVTSGTVTANGSTPFVEEKHTDEVVVKLSTASPQVPDISEKTDVTTEIFPEHGIIHTTDVPEILKFDNISTTSETITVPNQTVKPLVEDSEEATEYFITEYLPTAQPTQVDIIGKKSTTEKVSLDEETKSTFTTISPSEISDFSTVKGETSQGISTNVRITSETEQTSTIATAIDTELSTSHFETSTETDLSDSNSILGSQPTNLTEVNEEAGIKISTTSLTPDIETSTGFSDFLESSPSDKPFNVTISEVKEHSKPVHDTFSETKEPLLIKDKSPSGITEQAIVSYTSTTLKLDETASETTTLSSDTAKYPTSETVTDKDYQKLGITGDINAELPDSPSTNKTAQDSTIHLSPEIVDQFVTQKETTSSGKEIINTSTEAETEIITERTTELPEAPSSHSDDAIDGTTAFHLNISTENSMKEEGVKHIPEDLIFELGAQSEQGIASTASVDEYLSKDKENGTVSFEQPVTSYDSFDERKTEPVETGKNISSVFAVNENISQISTFIDDTTTEYLHKLETTTKRPEIHDEVHEIKSDLPPFTVTIASEPETQTDSKALQNVSFTDITELTSVDKTVPKVQEKETGSRERATTAESFWHEGTSESTTSFLGLTETVVTKEDSEERVNTKTTDFIDITLISTTKKPTYHFESTEYTVLPTEPNNINDTHLVAISETSKDVNTVHNETAKIPEQISDSGAANANATITTQLNTDAIGTEHEERLNVTSVNYDLSTLGSETDFPEEASEYDEQLHTKKDLKDALSTPSDVGEESDIRLITSVIPDVEDIIYKENQTVSDDRQFTTVHEITNAFNDSADKSTDTEFMTTSTEKLSTQASSNESMFQISEKEFSTESPFIIQTSETESSTQPSKEVYSTHVTGDEFEINALKDEITTQISNRINIQTSTESLKAEFETSTQDSVTQKSTTYFAIDELQDKFETQSPKGETVTSAPDEQLTTQFEVKFETQTPVDGLVTKDELITDATKEEIKAPVLKDEFTHSSEEEFTTQTVNEQFVTESKKESSDAPKEKFATESLKEESSSNAPQETFVTESSLEESSDAPKEEFSTQASSQEKSSSEAPKEKFATESLKEESSSNAPKETFVTESSLEKSSDAPKGEFSTESSSQEKSSSEAPKEKFATESLKEESSNAPKETFVTESSLEESSDAPKEEFSTQASSQEKKFLRSAKGKICYETFVTESSLEESSDAPKKNFFSTLSSSSQEKRSSEAPKEKFATESLKEESSSNAPKETFVTESSLEESSDAPKEEFSTESSSQEKSSSDAPKETFATESLKEESSSNAPKETFVTESSLEESSDAPKEEFSTQSSSHEKSSSEAPKEKFATESLKEERSSNAPQETFVTESSLEKSSGAPKGEFSTESSSQEKSSSDAPKEKFATESFKEESSSNAPKETFVTESSLEKSSDAPKGEFSTESSSQEKSSSDAPKEKFATESFKEESSSNAPKETFVTESSLEESSDAPKEEFSTQASSQEKSSSEAPKEKFATESLKEESSSNAPKETFVTESSLEKSSDAPKGEFSTESSSQEKSSSEAPKEKFATVSLKEESSSNAPKETFVTESSLEESSDAPKEEFSTQASSPEKSSSEAPKEKFATESLKEESSSNAPKETFVTESSLEESSDAPKEEFSTESSSQEKSSSDAPKETFATESLKEESSSNAPKESFVTESSLEESSDAPKEEFSTESSSHEKSSSEAPKEKFATESLKEESSSNAPKEAFVTESSTEKSSDSSNEEFATESYQEKSSSYAPEENFATEHSKDESYFNTSEAKFVPESSTEEISDVSKEEFVTESSQEKSSSDAPKEKFATGSTVEESSSNATKENFVTESSTEESSNAPKVEFSTESPEEKSSSDASTEEFSTEVLKEESPDASKEEFSTEVLKEDVSVQTTKDELAPQTSQDEPITETSNQHLLRKYQAKRLLHKATKDVFSVKISTEELNTQVTELSETSKTDDELNSKFTPASSVLPTGSESAENVSTESSFKIPDISPSILEEKLTESDPEVETSTGIKDYTITLVPDNVEIETTNKISNLPTDFIQPESVTSKSTVTYPPRDYTTLSLDENVKVVFVENTTGKFPEILSVIKVSHEEPPPKIDGSLSKFDTTEDSLTSSYSPSLEDKLVYNDLTNSTFDVTEAKVHSESNKDSFQETTHVIDDKLTSIKTDNVDFPIASFNLTNLNETKSSLSDDTFVSSMETTFTVTDTPSTTGITIKASTDATDESLQQEILKTQTTEEFSVIGKNISTESAKTTEFEDQLFTKSTDLKHVTPQPILPGLTEVISDGLSTPVSVTITQDQSEGSSDSENFKDSHFSEESGITDHPSTDIYLLQNTQTSGDNETRTYSTKTDILVDGAHSSSASESSVSGVEEKDSSHIYTEVPLVIKDLQTANSTFPQDVKSQQTTVSFSFDDEISHGSTHQEKHAGTFIPDGDLTRLPEIITSDSTTPEIPHLATNFTQADNETEEVLKHKEASPQVTYQELINSSSTDFSVSSPAYENVSQTQEVQTSTETEILTEQAVHSTKLFTIINEADEDVSPNATLSIGSSVTDSLLPTTVSVSLSNDVFESIDGASPKPTNDSLDNGKPETEISVEISDEIHNIEIADENQTQDDLLENTSDEFDVSTSYTQHDLPVNATTIQPSIEPTFKEIFDDLSEHSAEAIDTYTGTPGDSTEIKSNKPSVVETTTNISSTDIKEYESSSKLPTDVVTEEIIDLLKTTLPQEKESISSFSSTSSETITQKPLTEEILPTVESHSEVYIDEKRTGSTTEEFQDDSFLGIQTTTEKDTSINVEEVETKVTERVSSTSPAETEEKHEFSTSSYDNETNIDVTQSSETGNITEPKVTETVHEFSTNSSALLSVTDTSSTITETSSVTSTTPTLPVRGFEPEENETYSQTDGTAVHITAKPIKDYVLQKNLTAIAHTTPFSQTTASDSFKSGTTVKPSELLSTVVSHSTESTLTDTQPTRTANVSDESSLILQLNDSSSEIPHIFGTEDITSFISTDFPEEDKHRSPEVSSVTSPQTDQGTKAPFTTPVYTDLLKTVSEIFDKYSPVAMISATNGSFESQYPTTISGFGLEDYQHLLQEEGICFYEGRIFPSAKQIPRRDPCEFCFCFRSEILCLQQACPPPIRNCFATPIPGFCCPRFHCPVHETHFNISTTTTTTAQPRLGQIIQKTVEATGCEINGKVYRVNQLVRPASGPCMQCRCEYGGIMKCDPKECQPQAPLLLRLNKAFFRK